MDDKLCMNCFNTYGRQFNVCPRCGYVEGTPPEQPHCLVPGTILGNHFIVGTVIGFGGFGITYKCFDMTLANTVAVKEFFPKGLVNRAPGESKVGQLSGEKRQLFKEQKARFLAEARSIAQFGKAKDIVNVYDYFEENGTAYIIMEYIDGVLLKDYLDKQGVMEQSVALGTIMPIIEAVKKIHSKGIIHRDISPDNIFILDERSIKIFDFGAAQLNDSKEGQAGEQVIKMGYSAPEQYRDKSRQGFYTDIYSVGAILYQMLTGKKPIESTEREHKDRMKSPLELGVKVNSNVDRAVMEAMAVQPELRYQGIQQFEDALRNKRVAEYPKDKIRKRKRKRNWIIATVATLVLTMAVGITLAQTVFKDKSEVFDTTIADNTTITIWVENQDQKTQLDNLYKKGLQQGEEGDMLSASEQSDPDKWQKFWDQNKNITVDVQVHPNMADDLSVTPEEQQPNMYMTDHVPDYLKTDYVSLEGIYDELDAENNYAYLVKGNYEKEFPNYSEMPTGLDTVLVYACNIKASDDNTLVDSSTKIKNTVFNEDNDDNNQLKIIKQSDLNGLFMNITSDRSNHSDVLSYDNAELMNTVVSSDSDWNKYFDGDIDVPNCTMLSTAQKINQAAAQEQYRLGTVGSDSTVRNIYGNNIVAGVAFRKHLTDLVNDSSLQTQNKIEDFSGGVQTYVVLTDDSRIPVIYSERYAIRKSSETSQIKACKRMLYMMMQGIAQSKKVDSGVETTFPIRREQLEQFTTTHRNMADFYNMYADEDRRYDKTIIIGNNTGDMYLFFKNLGALTDNAELNNYCTQFAADNDLEAKSSGSDDSKKKDDSSKSDSTTAAEDTTAAATEAEDTTAIESADSEETDTSEAEEESSEAESSEAEEDLDD